jgi:hypothetical protein
MSGLRGKEEARSKLIGSTVFAMYGKHLPWVVTDLDFDHNATSLKF